MRALRLLASIALIGLSGCSYGFDVSAVLMDGQVTFVVDRGARSRPKCVSSIQVRAEQLRGLEGETVEEWAQRAYAWRDEGGYECEDRFPVVYGRALKGVYDGGPILGDVAAKPLRVGTIYEVTVHSGATGYGAGRFRLLPDGRVEYLGRASPPSGLTGEDG